MDSIHDFINTLTNDGWNYISSKTDISQEEIKNERLKKSPSDFKQFVSAFELLSNRSDTVWFTSLKDYELKDSQNSFVWNEFEMNSLEYAEDEDEKKEIISFWETTLPFLISVKDSYSYIAIIIEGKDFGKIVYGQEPIYEETVPVCNSFREFLELFSAAISNGFTKHSVFQDFI